jgi:excisionase family DNA binding protein
MEPKTTFLTVSELAASLRVSDMTIYRLITGGDIRAVKIGRSYRIPIESVEEWLARGGDARRRSR